MESDGVASFDDSTDDSTITFLMVEEVVLVVVVVEVPTLPIPLDLSFPLSARCDSCKARRSALFNFGFFGGMTRFLGTSLFDLMGFAAVIAAVVAAAGAVDMVSG